ncbi:SusC/RagA family TonB-linked outer membrane protein [Chitinophaga tropicalis]|nr:SusC/RagA family TonB-linked outer membrane protein [Chitinophaga tropicalis]
MTGTPKAARFMLVVILMHASFCLHVNAQLPQHPGKRAVTLVARQVTIDYIIKQVRQQTDVEFRYVPDEKFQRRLNVNFVNTRLDDVLAFVLNGTGLTWITENGGISIIKASVPAQPLVSKPKPPPSPADTLLITGKSLDEAVIIGYGTTTQRFNTGNVISVKGDTAYSRSVNNVLLLLQGRVAGMMVTQTSGMPGTELKVQLRGQTSLFNGTEPLFIVDDIPYNSILTKGLGSQIWSEKASSFGFINPDDIASIDVLKDADATAIYGSRGANGVVLITTKRGRPGKISTRVNASQGFARVARHVPLLNTPQYLEMRREAFRNDNVATTDKNAPDLMKWDTSRYTDWQKELIGNAAAVTNLQASVSGGTPLVQFLVSGHYRHEQTVFPGPFKNSQAGMHFSLGSAVPGKRFSGTLTGSFFSINSQLPGHDFTAQIMLPPNAPPAYLENGSLNYDWLNPYIGLVGPLFNSNIKNLLGSLSLQYEILPRLKLKTNIGYHWLPGNSGTIILIAMYAPALRPNKTGSWSGNDFESASGIIEPQVTYHTCLGNLSLEAVAGGTYQGYEVKREELTALGYKRDDQLGNLDDADSLSRQFLRSSYRYVAVFGRTKFKWRNKYLLNLSVRRDGSSRYGPRKQFAFFYAAGAGWIFSSEPFMAPLERVLSFGKLRASFGTTGNDQIGDYQYLDRYENVGGTYQGIIGLLPVNLYNADFAWEQTRKMEIGLETGFLKNKLLLSASYYNYRSTNQLVDYPLPDINGASNIIGNLPAVIRNTGWEFVLTGHHLKNKNFEWSSVFNISFARNKLIAYPDPGIGVNAWKDMLGQPLSKKLVFQFRGTDPAAGTYTYTNAQGDAGPAETAVRKIPVNTAPDFFGGWENNIRYRRFQLDMLFQFVKQQGINDMYDPQYMPGFQRNQYINVLDRWQQPGDVAAYQRFTQSGRTRPGYQAIFRSDRGYVDASYIRCKYLNLSWQLPVRTLKQLGLDDARLYVQAHNLFTITGYQGLDPETQSGTALPPLRVMAAGVQLTL